ncbi:MAG: TrmB family transcriptional regulator [Candidatus Methanomethyliales bacterium]|nr:TrmB family transcriptional regulator [Candidatus Methanomethylicales archaeon]
MSEGEVLRILRGCGLTETEAKVYLALIKGRGDAKEISARSKVPYSKIHTVLTSLQEKSLITASSDRPTIYSAKSVGEGLGEYKIQMQKEIEEAFKRAEQVLTAIQGEPEKSDIWIIKSGNEILSKAYQMLRTARRGVKLALPVLPEWLSDEILPVLTRLRAQQVEVNMLVTKNVSKETIQKLSGLSTVRSRDKMFGGGIIVDDAEVMLFIGGSEGVMGTAIWASHPGLVQLASTYFDFLWAGSEAP